MFDCLSHTSDSDTLEVFAPPEGGPSGLRWRCSPTRPYLGPTHPSIQVLNKLPDSYTTLTILSTALLDNSSGAQ